MKQVILYGIAGASKQYKAIGYWVIDIENYSTSYAKYCANIMRTNNPTIEHVYQIDNRYGLKREYTQSTKLNSIESCAIFKDTLEREGWKVI